MFKYPVTILLILLMATQTFSKWCLIIEFRINRDYIAKNLCVNRFKPSCCCRGKCYIDKKIAGDEPAPQMPAKGIQNELNVLQTHTQDGLPAPVMHCSLITHSTRHLSGNAQEHIMSFYPPPKQGILLA